MFEFSFAAIIMMAVVGALVWHLYATKILGYVSKAEADLRADWAKFQAELQGAHDVTKQRVSSVEQLVTPAASAGVTNAQIAPTTAAAPLTPPTA